MVDVASLQVRVDTTDLARGEAALESFTAEGRRAQTSVSGLGPATAKAGRASGQFGRQVQNASFQIGDFATQVASGQRASVAFAQQFPQLAGGFGVWGAAIGAVVAIGAALVPVIWNMLDGAESLDDAMSDLEETSDRLNSTLKILRTSTADLVSKYGEAATQVREFALAQAELEAAQAARRFSQEVDILGDVIDGYTRAQNAGRDYANTLNRISKDFGLSRSAAAEFEAILENLENAGTIDAQAASLEQVLTFLRENNVELSKIPEEMGRAISEMIVFQRETAAAKELMRQLAGEAEGVTVGVPLFNQGFSPSELLPPTANDDDRPPQSVDSPRDTFAVDLERLRESLRTEREVVDAWYNESQALLEQRRAMEILGEQGHREALLAVEEEYQRKVRDIRLSEQDRALSYQASFFGAMAQAASSGGEKMAKAAAVFGAVEATVNAYRAAAQALADPSVPFWGKAAAYASVLATGLGAVAAIRQAGSGGGTTASTAAPEAPAAANVNTSPRVALTLVGSESATYSKAQVRDLINAINEEVEGGAIVRLA